MDSLAHLLNYILHIDTYLLSFVTSYGIWTYIILFLIIFCETGLVITPFLPGDSLLFAAGSIAANTQQTLSIELLFVVLTLASIFGNKTNYLIGKAIGPRIFTSKVRWLNQQYLQEAHQFYEKHGGKTIIMGRFLPILRTFAPFVAGIGAMSLRWFSFFNVLSALLWIGSLLGLGYFFGSFPFIKNHFSFVIYAIILISLLPPLITFIYQRSKSIRN